MDQQKAKIIYDKLLSLKKRIAYQIAKNPGSVDMGKMLNLAGETEKRLRKITNYLQ